MEQWGYAAVQIIPSLKGVQATMDRELSAMAPAVGAKAGRNLGASTRRGFRAGLGDLGAITAQAVAAGTVALGAGAAAATVYGVKLAAANEVATVGFETTLGSAGAAKDFLEDLASFAADTPFDLPSLRTAASRLTAVGLEANRVIPIMETLGDATSGMGTGSEGIERAVRALTQMRQKGKVQAEEMLQLAEAGIPAWEALAAQMNVSIVEAQRAVTAGTVSADVVFDALENKAGPALGRLTGLMDKQSETLTGLWNTYRDEAGQDLAKSFEPTVDELKDMLPLLTDVTGEVIDRFAPALATAAGEAADLLPPLVDGLGEGLELLEKYGPAAAGITGALVGLGKSSIPFFGQFIPGGPVALGLAGLIATTPEARDALVDLGEDVVPVAIEFGERLLPVLDDLQEIAGDVLPVALDTTGVALVTVLNAGMPVVELVGDLSGLLADHTEIVLGVGIAYGAVKFGSWVSGLELASSGVVVLARNTVFLRDSITTLAATRGVSTAAASMQVLAASAPNLAMMASGVRDLASGMLTVPDWNKRLTPRSTAGLDKIRTGFSNIAKTSVSAGAIAGGALAGIAIGATAASFALDKLHESGRRDASEFLAGLDDVDTSSLDSMAGRSADILAEIQRLQQLQAEGSTNRFDDEKLAAEQAALGVELAANNVLVERSAVGMRMFRDETGLTADQVMALADAAGIGLPDAFDETGAATPELIAKWEELQSAAKITGTDMDEALRLDPEILAANVKVIEEAQSAVAEAYASFGDVLQVTDDPVDPKQVEAAREAVAEAERRLREVRDDGDAAALEQARKDLDDARESLSDLLATDSPLNPDKIEAFYRDVLADTEDFSADIQRALELGYDPEYVTRLMQAGPAQAGPILDQLTGDVDQAFVDMVNNAENAISNLSSYAVEAARLQQIAITTTGEGGQQMSEDLATATAISIEMMKTGGLASIAELASVAGTTEDEVVRIAREFGLNLQTLDERAQMIIDKLSLGSVLAANAGDYGEGSSGRPGPPRAGGGPVVPGVVYPINEFGLEGFEPAVPGEVIPNAEMRRRADDARRRPTGGRRYRGARDAPSRHVVELVGAGRAVTRDVGHDFVFGGDQW
jgi:tape measure domain-containing protein